MKKIFTFALILLIARSFILPVSAVKGTATYSGNAGEFIFSSGGNDSLTDLFPAFRNIMPGQTITQSITVKNNANNDVKVEIYMRSKGATADSEQFLSQLRLQVKKSKTNTMGYMFDAQANEPAQLSDWVCLGMLYSGGKVDLDVILSAPKEMGNEYSNQTGCVTWEFMVIEYPVEPSDPQPPQTGDPYEPLQWSFLCAASVFAIVLIMQKKKAPGK